MSFKKLTVTITEYVFPLFDGKLKKDIEGKLFLDVQQCFGTAFSIGNGFFVTAGHVLMSIREKQEEVFLGKIDSQTLELTSMPVSALEIFEDYDVGIFQVNNHMHAEPFKWKTEHLYFGTDFQTFGYPFAYDIEHREINVRWQKGHVVSNRRKYDLKAKPLIYEISINCPKGSSGSPLITTFNEELCVSGLILGSEEMEMEVFKDKEILDDGKSSETVIRTNGLCFGIVLTVESM